jgi:NADH dehydrogenase
LTHHPERPHALQGRVEPARYRFDDPAALARSLEGAETLYTNYWVRFEHGSTTYAEAVESSRALFAAARRAGVARIVHVSIANPSIASPLPYYRGKALVEEALAQSGVPYAVVRPTWLFGGNDILANNIAWILRRVPVFAIPGDGRYRVQPVHVDDFARLCVEAAGAPSGTVIDAAGPDVLTFEELVRTMAGAIGRRRPILHVPAAVMAILARGLGLAVRDVVLTPDEIRGLTAGLLESHQPVRGTTSFVAWLQEHAPELGTGYANELRRHFR